MINFVNKKLLLISLILINNYANAEAELLMKIRAQLVSPKKSIEYADNMDKGSYKNKGLGYGLEVAASYFIRENIALEASVGINRLNFDQSPRYNNKSSYHANFIPLSFVTQYHFSPDEQFSPYLGVGYHYGFMNSSSDSSISYKNSCGPVLQFGLDYWNVDETMVYNLDIKKYFGKINLIDKYNQSKVKGKYKFSPITLSAGVGFNM